MSGVFDLDRIAAAGLVAQVDYHESIGSTSDRALELGARGEVKLPLLVLAERQTAGRGRGVNRWWSDEGALTFSLVLEAPAERLPVNRWPQVALAAGVAVCEALAERVPRAELQVKWPNDVFLGGRKVGGILSESVVGWRERLVVGVGINVNNRGQETGDRRQGTGDSVATSLVEEDGLVRDLTEVLLGVLDEFDRRWGELMGGEFGGVAEEFRRRCFLTGKMVRIEQPGGRVVFGLCRGIDEEGALVGCWKGGEQRVVSGTVVGWGPRCGE